jgi:hypothetical protein
MRLQEAPIDKLEICFECARGLLFAPRSQSKYKDSSKKETNDT